MSATLHYIFDPFCGWCYVIAPLIRAAQERNVMPIVLHCGGMMTGDRKRQATPDFRELVISHEHRMQALSGQPFGDAYRDGLLRDPRFVYDSEPPSAAILAADTLGGRGLDMMFALQKAHYIDGRNTTMASVLAELAVELGIEREAFERCLTLELGKLTLHFEQSRRWLVRAGGQGFPTLAVEQEGGLRRVETSSWFGKPQAFVEFLASL